MLDEVRFAIRFCGVSPLAAHCMVTTAPATILRLANAEGFIEESGFADLIAVRDTGQRTTDRLETLSMNDIELVIIGGRVQLAAEAVLERLPFAVKGGLEPLSIDGSIRWLRAPVKALLHQAEEVLGRGEVRLGSRKLLIPADVAAEYVS